MHPVTKQSRFPIMKYDIHCMIFPKFRIIRIIRNISSDSNFLEYSFLFRILQLSIIFFRKNSNSTNNLSIKV